MTGEQDGGSILNQRFSPRSGKGHNTEHLNPFPTQVWWLITSQQHSGLVMQEKSDERMIESKHYLKRKEREMQREERQGPMARWRVAIEMKPLGWRVGWKCEGCTTDHTSGGRDF
jgi:hypothetical protein